jgi:serine/threonine protein kinase
MEPIPKTPPVNRLLFIAAAAFSDAAERHAFLAFACRGEESRIKRIEDLLDARRDAEEFFDVRPTVHGGSQAATDEGGLGACIGPYRLIDRLGSGGCGVVYLAEQLEPVKRKVALKIIRLGMDTENVIARFEKEREALALMDHPHIARVLDVGTTVSSRPYFVMELVDGEKITDFCDLHRLGLRQRLLLFTQVCDAIQHAHQKGVIHRDIKPSNVLVRIQEGNPVSQVIDFGIAKATAGNLEFDSSHTHSGNFIGTPAYMSPEQAAGGLDIDTRSDIYSLGALLYELLAGKPPFSHERLKDLGVEEIRTIVCGEEPLLPSERLRAMPPDELNQIAQPRATDPQRLRVQLAGDLDWIVMKALDKDRKRRYETANGLAMDVRRYLQEEVVLARPPSPGYLLMKLIRRNRVLFAAAAIALSGLVAGLGTSTWLFLSEREARKEQARLRVDAEQARVVEIRLRQKAQAAGRLTQAAVLVRYGNIPQADSLLAELPPELVPLSLEAADTLLAVAEWNLLQGRWKTAAERFSALVPVITSVDLTDTDRMSRILMPAATAIRQWGAPEQYQQLRKLALERFSDTSNDGVAAQVTKAVLLDPPDSQTLRRIAPLEVVLHSAVSSPEAGKSQYLLAWRMFSMGLLSYRNGQDPAATDWIFHSLKLADKPAQLVASNRILLAMVHLRNHQPDDARQLLEEARGALKTWEAAPFKLGSSYDFWFDWINVRILLDEADRLLVANGH